MVSTTYGKVAVKYTTWCEEEEEEVHVTQKVTNGVGYIG